MRDVPVVCFIADGELAVPRLPQGVTMALPDVSFTVDPAARVIHDLLDR
jgi:hypothetical protein